MKSIALIARWMLSLILVFSTSAWSRDRDNAPTIKTDTFSPKAASRFLSIYRQSKSFDELLKQIEPKLAPADAAYLKKLGKSFEGQPLPKVQRDSEASLIFSLGPLTVPVEIVSLDERVFKINRHEINFGEMKTAQEHMEAIQAAFPRQSALRHHRPVALNLLLPEAHAFIPLLIAAVPIIVGAVITGYELYTSNSYYCNEILEAANACKPPIRKMIGLKDDFEEVKDAAAKKKKKLPNCPSYKKEEDKEAADEVQDEATAAIDTINAKSSSSYAKIIKCDIEWVEAGKCKATIDNLAKTLCMDVHKSLDQMARDAGTGGAIQKAGGQ